MSFDYRFEPPSATELEELAIFEQDCDHNCEQCWWDCEDPEEEP